MRTSTIHSAAVLTKSIVHTQSRIWLCVALLGMIVSCGIAPVGGLEVGMGIPRLGVRWHKNEFPRGFKTREVNPNMVASGKIQVGDVITHVGKREVLAHDVG